MSKKVNYGQFAKETNEKPVEMPKMVSEEKPVEMPVVEEATEEVVEETVEEVIAEEPVIEEVKPIVGVVISPKLNMRKAAMIGAPVVTVITEGTEVVIDMAASTDEFYKVCTATGCEGFCMKKFIEVE